MAGVKTERNHSSFLNGGGGAGALLRSHDWSASQLGPPETWSQALRTTVDLMLASKHAMCLAWGAELSLLYNDAYIPVLGLKHPSAFGRQLREVWSDIWDDIEPLVHQALAGDAVWFENYHLVMDRNGYSEDTWWQFSYSPARDDDGLVAGMLNVTSEMTGKVIAERRLAGEISRQRQMFEQAPGFINVLTGPDHVFEFANAAYRRLIGGRDPTGKSVRDALPELKDQGFYELLDRVFATGERFVARRRPVRLENPGGPAEGHVLDFIYEPITDEAGQVTGIFVEGYDVTDAHRAEMALRESDERQRTLLEFWARVRVFPDPDQIVHETLRALGDRLGAIRVAFVEMSDLENRGWIRGQWTKGNSPRLPDEIRLSDFGPSLINQLRAGATLRVEDVRVNPFTRDHLSVLDALHLRALVSVPLFRNVSFSMSMQVHQDQPRRWTDAEVALIEAVAERTWEAVERAHAETALRNSEERFRQFGEATADTLWMVDAATQRLEYLSPAFERIWGEPRERVMSDIRRWAEFVHPDDRETAYAAMPRLLKGESVSNEYRIVRADGEIRWILDIGFPIRDVAGRVVRGAGIAQDVTERRFAQDALRASEMRLRELNETLERRVRERTAELSESQRRFQGIFDSALQMMALLTLDGTVVEVNRTALDWSGAEVSQIVGRPLWQSTSMRDDPTMQSAVEEGVKRAATGETVRQEHELRGADGLRAIVDFSLKPVTDETGEPALLVAEGRDITALKEAQEALRQAQKMEAMGQLTGGVAHDFNNLLTPIIGVLDMLQRRAVGGEREQRLISGAAVSAERAKVLVQRLLAFARRQPLQPTAVDVGRLVNGMADLLASTAGPQVRVTVGVSDGLPPAKADPNQLEMALLNLGVNARDAMPEGGTLRITATRESVRDSRGDLEQGHYIRLSVADTGVGMDEATLARAVEPFFSTKEVGKGTGLGLSMAHGLAAQLGGALFIQSRPGVGTNVELWLPVSVALADDFEAPAAPVIAGTTGGLVLLVDDEDEVRASTADMLEELGYRVLEAGSGEAALALVAEGIAPDLLLADYLMPGITGVELARALREKLQGLPVLIVSGYAEDEGIEPDLPRLPKPFRVADLAASIEGLTHGAR